MLCDQTKISNLKKTFLLFDKLVLSKFIWVLIVFNFFSFSGFSQVSESKEDLLRSSLEASLAEFYKSDHPISSFYIERNFKPYWIGNDERLQSLARSISKAEFHGLPLSRYPLRELSQAIYEKDPSQRAKLELMATEAFLLFSQDLSGGILKPNKIDNNINVIPDRRDVNMLLGSLTNNLDLNLFVQELYPSSNEYKNLLNELRKLREITLNGSWGDLVPVDAVLAKGMTHENVPFLRKRLSKMGYPVYEIHSRLFDEKLNESVKRFQEYHGLNPDGVFGKRSIEAINVPPKTRLMQVLVNLERMRWNNRDRGSEYVLVNQPNFKAYFKSRNEKIWQSRVVIGLPSNQTA